MWLSTLCPIFGPVVFSIGKRIKSTCFFMICTESKATITLLLVYVKTGRALPCINFSMKSFLSVCELLCQATLFTAVKGKLCCISIKLNQTNLPHPRNSPFNSFALKCLCFNEALLRAACIIWNLFFNLCQEYIFSTLEMCPFLPLRLHLLLFAEAVLKVSVLWSGFQKKNLGKWRFS